MYSYQLNILHSHFEVGVGLYVCVCVWVGFFSEATKLLLVFEQYFTVCDDESSLLNELDLLGDVDLVGVLDLVGELYLSLDADRELFNNSEVFWSLYRDI